jgi:hypothetical protein
MNLSITHCPAELLSRRLFGAIIHANMMNDTKALLEETPLQYKIYFLIKR